MTNGDRIRQQAKEVGDIISLMSNEDLEQWLDCDYCAYRKKYPCSNECIEGIKAYLESEAE